MRPRQITHRDAAFYWSHPSQLEPGITPDMLPEGPIYMACGCICGAFRPGPWLGVWMADYGARPEGWGQLTEPAKAILHAFWDAQKPQLIVGWTDSRKRAALAFSKRIGFRVTGEMTLADGTRIVAQEWRPLWA